MAHRTPEVWKAPECAVAIEYAPEVLDDIRLAVVEAYYAFPRGGAEIGGVLVGSHEGDTVRITAFHALACEHAAGPSFTLSARDFARLEEILHATAAAGREAVGWYHSHTRSGIYLSAADLEIHQRYFPEPWQVALVLRPTSMVTRAGFFARGADGRLRSEASYLEFTVPALSGRPMARVETPVKPAPALKPPPAPERAPLLEIEPPHFGFTPAPPRPRRKHLLAALAVIALAAAALCYDFWLPYVPWFPAGNPGLWVFDESGTLQIRWDAGSRAVRHAQDGTLEIVEQHEYPIAVRLEPERLRDAAFSYERRTGRVGVRLILKQPNGSSASASVTFLGQAPAPRPSPEVVELRRQLRQAREDLIRQTMINEALRRGVGGGSNTEGGDTKK
ncbi:MAG: Mov34/MPN/PAD-1 family protein [Bryobacteraceae bacterium]